MNRRSFLQTVLAGITPLFAWRKKDDSIYVVKAGDADKIIACTITCTPGEWQNAPVDFSYQWRQVERSDWDSPIASVMARRG